MQEVNEHPINSKEGDSPENSDNVTENIKYIKQLELQRAVLNKLIDSNLEMLMSAQNKIAYNSKSNKAIIKKK
ncbi:MAG: hypothetical protein PHX54_01280 [Lentimicrobiaceae bacterium]|jgi:hypothetical protein|nr:hypothetical protein [Lentimicrobiaceae bacterium]